MKIILYILWASIILLWSIGGVFAASGNLNIGAPNPANTIQNDHLKNLSDPINFFSVSIGWEKWIKYTLVNIAKSMKNVFFFIAWIYLLILVLRILFADKTEEEISRYKNGVIWISIGLIVMQMAFSFVNVLFDEWVSGGLAANFISKIINPLIDLLETGASILFIGIAIYSFYKIITANGDEEAANSWKKSVIYAIWWYVIMKFARALVGSVYGTINCSNTSFVGGLVNIQGSNCIKSAELSGLAQIIVRIIDWANSFIGIIIIVMIIYTGFQVLLSAWDEDKLKKAKSTLLYIAIWVGILVLNYLILTFFIFPESTI